MNEHTSQPLSQRLQDKGFRGEHESVWIHHWAPKGMQWTCHGVDPDDTVNEQIPAYTFTELWGVLPNKIVVGLEAFYWVSDRQVRKLPVMRTGYWNSISECYVEDSIMYHESPAEAVGLLLEWLIDNGHIVKGE